MPADRTKRMDSFGRTSQHTSDSQYAVAIAGDEMWAPYQESMHASALSFIANVTPIDFSSDTPPPLVDPPCTEFILFPPAEEVAAPRRQPHSKKKPENHIPRPPNAFILFRSSFIKSQHVSTEVETNHSTLSKIIGITWQSLPEQERQIWHQKAKEALEEHKRKFPKYAFRPVQTKSKGAVSEKRKVREVEPKDIKRCEKIAQLLVEGKKGPELENAIQEFDKHHVPEIVTRFETPITARTYRRSSSAPISETEITHANKSFLQTDVDVPKRNKPRAASTRPTRCSSPASVQEQVIMSCPSRVSEVQTPLPKQEVSFNFDDFSFGDIASPMSTYECDPLAGMQSISHFGEAQFSPALTIDTSFMGTSDWAHSPSPMSPTTPDYLMTPTSDPVITASPYDGAFDAFDQPQLQKSFENFTTFPNVVDQSCVISHSRVDIGSDGVGTNLPLYGYNQQHLNLENLDLDFSALMNSIPQYAI